MNRFFLLPAFPLEGEELRLELVLVLALVVLVLIVSAVPTEAMLDPLETTVAVVAEGVILVLKGVAETAASPAEDVVAVLSPLSSGVSGIFDW